jgi:hypothetical protein
MESGGIAPSLSRHSMEPSGQLEAPAALYSQGNMSLVEPHSRSERCRKEKMFLLSRQSNPDLSAVQPLALQYTDCAIPTRRVTQRN